MRSILEELWYGNLCPNSGCREGTKEAGELMGYIADHHDALLGMLTDKQKETLEKFRDYKPQKYLKVRSFAIMNRKTF